MALRLHLPEEEQNTEHTDSDDEAPTYDHETFASGPEYDLDCTD